VFVHKRSEGRAHISFAISFYWREGLRVSGSRAESGTET
jgi:hypothetical protein